MNPGGCNLSGNNEIIVNAGKTQGNQSDPDVAADKDGNFVVVWTDDNANKGTTQIFMRGFDASGKPRFDIKTVNQKSDNSKYQARVAMAPDGKFVVSWTDKRSGNNTPQIWVRGFNADGSQAFAERAVADKAAGTRIKSDVFIDNQHRFIVAWEDDSDANGSTQSKFRLFNADGTPRSNAITANTVSTATKTDHRSAVNPMARNSSSRGQISNRKTPRPTRSWREHSTQTANKSMPISKFQRQMPKIKIHKFV